MSNRTSPYLFYTEYYLISGAYHIVNVVNDVLTYTASCSDHIKGYLQNKVINKKNILNEMVHNTGVNDPDVDEDGFVVIRMRRPKIKNDSAVNVNNTLNDVVINPTTTATATTATTMAINLDDNLAHSIVTNLLNGILDNLDHLDHLDHLDKHVDENNESKL